MSSPAPSNSITMNEQQEPPALSMSLEQMRQKHKLPCLMLGRSTAEKEAYGAVGNRRYGTTTALQIIDKFPILSLSKAMTGTLIMLLVKDGLLSWESTMPELFPDMTELHATQRALTVKVLSSQRSGLVETWKNKLHVKQAWQDPALSAVEGRRLRAIETLSQRPGGRVGEFNYCNANYIILGAIVDRVTGKSWEEAITERMFKPLGMVNVGFGLPEDDSGAEIWGHWPAKLWWDPVPVSGRACRFFGHHPAINPAGGVYCTMQDYLRFARLHLDGARGVERLGLTRADFAFLHTSPFIENTKDPMARYTYGGWMRPFASDLGEDSYCLWHPGGWLFYAARASIDVSADVAMVAMTPQTAVPAADHALQEAMKSVKL